MAPNPKRPRDRYTTLRSLGWLRRYRRCGKLAQCQPLPRRRHAPVLTTTEIAAHLQRLTYKDGWEFHAYDGRWEGQHIVIRTVVPDTYKPGEQLVLDVHSMLPPMRDTEQLEEWLAWRLGRIEVHEMREFLKRDGRVLFDPHAEYADRDLAA
jgi:hypothetical protein